MKATISVNESDPGKIFSLGKQMKRGFASHKDVSVKIFKDKKAIYVNGNFDEEMLNSIAKRGPHKQISYSVEYKTDEPKETKKQEQKTAYPVDYGALKGEVKRLKEEGEAFEGTASRLEQELLTERRTSKNKIKELKTEITDLEERCSTKITLHDFLSEMMMRENKRWANSVRFYNETIDTYSQLLGISFAELEKQSLDYEALRKKPEFKELEKEYKQAQAAKRAADDNEYITLDPKAKEILERVEQMTEEDKQIQEVREELEKHFSKRNVRIAATINEKGTLLTLPFTYKTNYSTIEDELIQNIDQNLTDAGLIYTKENFNDLLRYSIHNMKKRARNNLLKVISTTEDALLKLGGKRETVRVEVY